MTTRTIRTYAELSALETFAERFRYLLLQGRVGRRTFGTERWVNQRFYTSRDWKNVRHHVIARDLGCDLGVPGYEINEPIYIHHINPMRVEDLEEGSSEILDPDFLISVTHRTHNAIHYGDDRQIPRQFVERRPGDTRLW